MNWASFSFLYCDNSAACTLMSGTDIKTTEPFKFIRRVPVQIRNLEKYLTSKNQKYYFYI